MKLKNMRRSEDTEQIHVCNWAAWNENRYPELKWLHHIPNGGSRNKAEAAKLKSMGVKSGVSDLHLPYAKGVYIGLYIEMKYGTGRHQDSQIEFLHDMAKKWALRSFLLYGRRRNHSFGRISTVRQHDGNVGTK